MQMMVNVGYGMIIGTGLFFIGVPYALLWGFVAAVLRYVPYLGAWLAALLPVALSFLVFESWMPTLLVVGLFLSLDLIINMLLEPWLYGRGIGVSVTALLVMVAFWAWLWGPIGLLLATPLTVCLVVLGRHVPSLKFFDTLLGDRPALEAPMGYYQRLLARDEDEAADIAEAHMKKGSIIETYDQVLLPSLAYAKRDLEREALSDGDKRFVLKATRAIADELALLHTAAIAAAGGKTDAPADGVQRAVSCRILGVPSRDDSDEAALFMLSAVLDPAVFEVIATSSAMLSAEVIDQVKQTQPDVLCIAALAPGGVAQTRLLCRRLRSSFPDLDPGRTLGSARRNRQDARAGDDVWSLGFRHNHARDLSTDRRPALPEVQITREAVEALAIGRARRRALWGRSRRSSHEVTKQLPDVTIDSPSGQARAARMSHPWRMPLHTL
jgi:hypothetical protein